MPPPGWGVGEVTIARECKESGIDWLGCVPREWEVAPLYSRYEVALGKMLDSKRVTGEHLAPYLRNVDVRWDSVNVEGLPEMDFSLRDRLRYGLRVKDLLVCEGGEVGRTAMWLGELAECYYQKAIHRLRPLRGDQHPRFLFYGSPPGGVAERVRFFGGRGELGTRAWWHGRWPVSL